MTRLLFVLTTCAAFVHSLNNFLVQGRADTLRVYPHDPFSGSVPAWQPVVPKDVAVRSFHKAAQTERGRRDISNAVIESGHCEHIELMDCSDFETDEMTCMLTATGMTCCVCTVFGVTVDTRTQFQPVIGFGGAFTDSSGINMAALQDQTLQKLLEAYFGPTGLNYNIGRVPIASTDFSTREYSYDDVEGDFNLKEFKLEVEDIEYKVIIISPDFKITIPFIRRAMNLTKGNLRLFASPWSAPGWMKTTGRMKGGGALKEDKAYHQAYANYFVRFFEEYAKYEVSFWGLTVQNEPTSGAFPMYPWQTMLFTAKTQRDFVRNFLGPRLKNSSVTKDLKVMALDDGRIMLPGWADTIFEDSETSKYVDGIAVHWYGNNYTPASVLTTTHERHPEKFILATEPYFAQIFSAFQACTGYSMQHGPILGDWYRAERYASDIITDFNNFVAGWTDWNLCLDETGGPNWVFNVVDSPIIVNRTANEFYKQPMFYAMGHFSKFVPRGAVRVNSKVTGTALIETTAVIHNGRRSLVLLNRNSKETPIFIEDIVMNKSMSVIIAPNSIVTFVWDKA
uniref:Glucosylceramidase n=1 Tax=Heterorhabditis bacteriophora TaxID=37862 RepID=A0A1I7XHV7_HETBA